jgi:hypothetical protein
MKTTPRKKYARRRRVARAKGDVEGGRGAFEPVGKEEGGREGKEARE